MYRSREIYIGRVPLGGNNPVRIQSMTSTATEDIEATVQQSLRLISAGSEYVRITAPSLKAAKDLEKIKQKIREHGFDTPLIADIHFNPSAAEIAARIVEKIRINPGNYIDRKYIRSSYSDSQYTDELQHISNRIGPLLNICKENGTVIRLGTNHGSLSSRILERYGNTAEGMVVSTMEYVEICRQHDFHNLVLSLKSSNLRVMLDSCRLLVEKLSEKGYDYPLHLGVTEAGDAEDGRIKSAAGIGILLAEGIGDTIRVSLTEDPVKEIPVARKIVAYAKEVLNSNEVNGPLETIELPVSAIDTRSIVLCADESKLKDLPSDKVLKILKRTYDDTDQESLLVKAAMDFTTALFNGGCDGIWIESKGTNDDFTRQTALNILQATGIRISKTEFISCPSCGRTMFDIESTLKKVKERTSHLKGLKIAVMGCIVNGPGEMADAHYGYVGSGKSKVNLYKDGTLQKRNINEANAIDELIEMIKANGDWVEH